MMKLYFWVAMEILLFTLSFGIVMPATISAADTTMVMLGLGYLFAFTIPVGLWYIPRRIYKEYLVIEKGFPSEEVYKYGGTTIELDSVQPSAAGKRGSAGKSVREQQRRPD